MGKVAILTGQHLVGSSFTQDMLESYSSRIGFIEHYNHTPIIITQLAHSQSVPAFDYISEEFTIDRINEYDITTVVLAWWPKIVHKIHNSVDNIINTHPSYLPYSRGKHPYYWSIVEDTLFGVTIHRVNNGIDTGDILWQKEIKITPLDTGETLYHKSCIAMTNLLEEHLDDIANEKFPLAVLQVDSNATSHKIKDFLDHEWLDIDGVCFVREFIDDLRARTFNNYHSGKRVIINGKKYRIHLNLVEDDEA